MKFIPTVSKHSWTLVAVLLFVLVAFSFYFFIYIPKQKKQVHTENYRTLTESARKIDQYFDRPLVDTAIDSCAQLDKTIDRILRDPAIIKNYFDIIIPELSSGCPLLNDRYPVNFDSLIQLSVSNTQEITMNEITYVMYGHRQPLLYGDHKRAFGDLYLIGLLEKSRFSSRVRRVDSLWIANGLILLFILIMSMPILKLIFLSPIERLTRLNVYSLGLAIVFGSGLISLLFVSRYSQVQSKRDLDNRLDDLAEEISTNLKTEIQDGYNFLGNLNSKNWVLEDKTKIGKLPFNDRDTLSSDTLSSHHKYKEIFWFDGSKSLQALVSKLFRPSGTFKTPIGHRRYYIDLVEKGGWKLPDSEDIQERFSFQSVVSHYDATHEAVICLPAGDSIEVIDTCDQVIKVAGICISTYLSALMDPVLKPGYGFVVVDNTGEVWFNSDKTNNLVDNFFEETRHHGIVSAAGTRNRAFANINYLTADHRAFIRPVADIPLYVITIYDKRYDQVRIIQALLINLALFIFSLLLVGILLLMLLLTTYKSSRLKKKSFLLEWLLPDKDMNDKYNLLYFSNLVIIAFITFATIIFFYTPWSHHFYYRPNAVFLIIVTQLWVFTFIYYLLIFRIPNNPLKKEPDIQPRSFKYHSKRFLDKAVEMVTRPKSLSRGFRFLQYAVVFITFLNILFISNFNYCIYCLLIYQIVLLTIMWVMSHVIRDLNRRDDESWAMYFMRFKKLSSNPYPLFALTWVIIISLFPVFYFYKFSTANETRVWEKYKQASLAKSVDNKLHELDKFLFTSLDEHEKEQFVKNEGSYLGEDKLEIRSPDELTFIDNFKDTLKTDRILNQLFRLVQVFPDINTMRYLSASSSDGSWRFLSDKDPGNEEIQGVDRISEEYEFGKKDPDKTELFYRSNFSDDVILISSVRAPFVRDPSVTVYFFLSIIVTIFILYLVISYMMRRIFAAEYRNYLSFRTNSLQFLIKRDLNTRIFLIRMENSGTGDSISKYLSFLDKESVRHIEINLRDIENNSYKEAMIHRAKDAEVVIFENFDYYSNNHDYYEKKAKMINSVEQLDMDKHKQIIILSSHHPLRVTNFYETMIKKTEAQQWHEKWHDLYESYHHAYANWKKFFDGYVKLNEPLKKEDLPNNPNFSYEEEEIQEVVDKELGYGNYLNRLEPMVYGYYRQLKEKAHKVDIEDIVLKIQSLAEPHYYALWSSLSKDERFVIFDLAKDGFVNVKNSRGIQLLLDKGLITHENNLRIFNQSFNNFILTVVDAEMEGAMEKELNEKGTWRLFKNIVIILIISVVSFIAISQPHLMANVNALITALIAVVGLLLKSGFAFGGKSAQAG